ncbi:Fe-S cluster assembly protein SufD [Rhodothalassium salexigens DSM 2132]|nr:Fe-S cluster assembly protein SufD [Rhodothalassium salexigens DSM 2132]
MTMADSPFDDAFAGLGGASAQRRAAYDRFRSLGLPSRRQEDWKYTDLAGLDRARLAPAATGPAVSAPVAGLDGPLLVLTNGRVDADASRMGDLPAGLEIVTDGEPASTGADNALAALNAAFAPQAVHVRVADGAAIDRPLQLLYRVTDADACAAHVRVRVALGARAALTLVERFEGDASAYWQNQVLDVAGETGSTLIHALFQAEGPRSVHSGLTRVALAGGARYRRFDLQTGAEIARNEVHVAATEAGAHADIRVAQMARAGQSLDTRSYLDHRVADTTSDQGARAVVDAQGRTAFQGKVHVARDAQRTDAQQQSKAILLDETAEANTKPELEIYADDVVCAHGATVGQLDAAALFYLVQRGLPLAEAKALLIEAFVADLFGDLDDDTLRDAFVAAAQVWFGKEPS